jgi:ABC-2 type transport system ATP-binding protein
VAVAAPAPAGVSAPAIRLAALSKSFPGHLGIGRTAAVAGLDLEIRTGEIMGLLGPNGAGKTTTLKLILGLLRPDAGEVRLLGRPPADRAVRARLGFLPESPYFYDHLTAEEFLDFFARLRGIPRRERRQRIDDVLATVGLAGRGGLALRKCSKGMVQRVALAQAIQHDPDIVILDEPMSGLDPIGRRDVRDLILDLRRRGRTVLFSSHILQDAEMLCDRVAILDRGRLRSVGRLDEMVARGVAWYEVTIRATGAAAWPGSVIAREGERWLLRVDDTERLSALIVAVKERGGEVSSVWPKRQTLEDLFLRELRQAPVHEEGS